MESDWVSYNNLWRTFEEMELNKSGVLVEIAPGRRQFLIGDINTLGGDCDHCSPILPGDTIIRYKTVWTGGKQT